MGKSLTKKTFYKYHLIIKEAIPAKIFFYFFKRDSEFFVLMKGGIRVLRKPFEIWSGKPFERVSDKNFAILNAVCRQHSTH